MRTGQQAAAPRGSVSFEGANGDVRFRHPRNWQLRPLPAPFVANVYSGPAVATVFAYRRRAVPSLNDDLEIARQRLVRAARQRDRTFEAFSSRVRRIAGVPAVDVRGVGTVGGRRVRIRSVHFFRRRGEYVVDGLAPPEAFPDIDRRVFAPLIESVRVKGSPPRATRTARARSRVG